MEEKPFCLTGKLIPQECKCFYSSKITTHFSNQRNNQTESEIYRLAFKRTLLAVRPEQRRRSEWEAAEGAGS